MQICKNLPYWTPLFTNYNTGIAWYRWFAWVWTYKEGGFNYFLQKHFPITKVYCFRIVGWQFEVRF
jgi:hypothetical protein